MGVIVAAFMVYCGSLGVANWRLPCGLLFVLCCLDCLGYALGVLFLGLVLLIIDGLRLLVCEFGLGWYFRTLWCE